MLALLYLTLPINIPYFKIPLLALKWKKECESRSVLSDSATPKSYTVGGIPQARIWEWVAFPSSSGSS